MTFECRQLVTLAQAFAGEFSGSLVILRAGSGAWRVLSHRSVEGPAWWWTGVGWPPGDRLLPAPSSHLDRDWRGQPPVAAHDRVPDRRESRPERAARVPTAPCDVRSAPSPRREGQGARPASPGQGRFYRDARQDPAVATAVDCGEVDVPVQEQTADRGDEGHSCLDCPHGAREPALGLLTQPRSDRRPRLSGRPFHGYPRPQGRREQSPPRALVLLVGLHRVHLRRVRCCGILRNRGVDTAGAW